MLQIVLNGPDRLRLYPLRSWLMQDLRRNLVGGPSFCVTREVRRGQPMPPSRLDPDDEEWPDGGTGERVHCLRSYDANG